MRAVTQEEVFARFADIVEHERANDPRWSMRCRRLAEYLVPRPYDWSVDGE